MWPALIGLAGFVLLVLIIGILFAGMVFDLIINAVVIYLVGIRTVKEIDKGWVKEYLWGAIIGILILGFAGNVIPLLWHFTTWLTIMFIVAQVIRYAQK
jgi:hypothetical protein